MTNAKIKKTKKKKLNKMAKLKEHQFAVYYVFFLSFKLLIKKIFQTSRVPRTTSVVFDVGIRLIHHRRSTVLNFSAPIDMYDTIHYYSAHHNYHLSSCTVTITIRTLYLSVIHGRPYILNVIYCLFRRTICAL